MGRLRGPWLSPGEQIFSIEHRSYPGLDNLLIVFKCGEDYNEHETDAELLTQKKKLRIQNVIGHQTGLL